MEYKKLKPFLCIFALLFASISILGQSKTSPKNLSQLKRRNPDGWFNLLVPKSAGKVEHHADVDGGFYTTDKLEVNFIYWMYKNTPNFLRDVSGNYSKFPMLACSKKSQVKTWKNKIDGKKAIIQRCVETDARDDFKFIYYVTFPKLKVYEAESRKFNYGTFNLTITYKNRQELSTAERIVRSLNFDK